MCVFATSIAGGTIKEPHFSLSFFMNEKKNSSFVKNLSLYSSRSSSCWSFSCLYVKEEISKQKHLLTWDFLISFLTFVPHKKYKSFMYVLFYSQFNFCTRCLICRGSYVSWLFEPRRYKMKLNKSYGLWIIMPEVLKLLYGI